MEPWEAYKIYLGLKLHFNSDYDYQRYGGKSRASKQSFLNRKDRSFFARVARKYKDSVKDFFIANFLVNQKGWIGNFNDLNYTEWNKRKQSLTYTFNNEMTSLCQLENNFDDIFKIENNTHPIIIKEFLAKRVSIETLIILQDLVNYIKDFDKKLSDDLVWPDIRRLIVKYSVFLNIDIQKCKINLLKIIKENL